MKDKQAVKPRLLERSTAAKVTQQLRQQTISALQGKWRRQRDDLLAEHGQVNLTNQEGHKEVDTDGDALSRGASLNGVHL